MVSFVIENHIFFEPVENSLMSITTGETVFIPLISSRLLELLLLRKGEVVPRDEIFTKLFEAYNIRCTNNNLNQYIRTLRRQIEYLCLDDVIIKTIPKIGFIIPDSVLVYQNIEKPTNKNEVALVETIIDEKNHNKWKCKFYIKRYAFILLMSIFLLLALWFKIYNNEIKSLSHSIPLTESEKIMTSSGCIINLISGSSPLSDDAIDKLQNDIFIKCGENYGVSYYVHFNKNQKNKERLFVMTCKSDKDKNPCESKYYSLWKN